MEGDAKYSMDADANMDAEANMEADAVSNTHDKHIQSLHQGHENIGGVGGVYHGVMQFLHPDVMTRVLRVLP
jgi:hypothetical protein